MDFKSLLLSLAFIVTIATCTDTEENKSIQKRSAESEGLGEPLDGLADGLMEDDTDMDKRRLMRYGRGAIMRYGRGGLMRYGKRGGLMRYGKRSGDEEEEDFDVDSAKRLFRWGKRSDDEAGDFKRLFRWGKREDENVFEDEVKRRLMRYGKRDGEKRIFRYGKRSGEDEDLNDLMEEEKRRLMRYGKRDMDEAKRRLMRYGRDIEIRAPSQPHVPFRFGEKDE